MLHVVCRPTDSRYTAEHVNILYDMVTRNLPEGCAGDFMFCGEPIPDGLHANILTHGQLPSGDTIVPMGHNLVITGLLDGLLNHEAIQICSYADAKDGIPKGISIVRFDGPEMPWEIKEGWVPMVYKIGGGTPASFAYEVNVSRETIAENILSAMQRVNAWIKDVPAHDGTLLICAGGPSLKSDFNSIKLHQANSETLYAVNGSHAYLSKEGIYADGHIILDARDGNAEFCPDLHDPVERIYASQCAPRVLDGAGDNLTLWHPYFDGVLEITGDKRSCYIGGGSTAGLKAIVIGYVRGYRKFHLYGYDSSYVESEGHAYSQPINDGERTVDAIVDGRSFRAAPWMIQQVEEFKAMMPEMVRRGCEFTIHGEGLLPTVASLMTAKPEPETVLTAVYDLEVSPPTYEFLSFLHEAEFARKLGGYTKLNIVFQPGPKDGFRDDNLPPNLAMRQAMLWRICVAGARLLPSVGDITVLKARKAVDGAIFPAYWNIDTPVSIYGPSYCHNLQPILSPSQTALEYVDRKYPQLFAVITLRSAKHWSNRNSDKDAWLLASRLLERNGITAVFVPDEDFSTPAGAYNICPEAFWDLDIRAALYECAVLSLGVSGGPTMLMAMTQTDYMIFDKSDASYPCGKDWLKKRHGFGDNPQFSSHGENIWSGTDSASIILPQIQSWIDVHLANQRKIA